MYRKNNRSVGTEGEEKARAFLETRGCKILKANYRCPGGEIDLIAKEGETILFVEVKYRTGEGSGQPEEAVDSRKQRTISRCALHYLARRGSVDVPCRFDVISIAGEEIRWHRNAFDYQE